MKIIDPHLHLFDLAKGQYGWLKPDVSPFWPDKSIIHRDFSQQDLKLTPPLKLAGFVHIEAGFNNQQPWQEIAWLEHSLSLDFRSIGQIDLTASRTDFINTLAKLSRYSSLVGVRHILDQQAQSLLKQARVRTNLARLAGANLIFEAQLNGCDTQAIGTLIAIAQAHPELTIILNHANFCPARQQDYRVWQKNIRALAQNDNIFIKASGWEMVERQYQPTRVSLVVSFLIECFGYGRVMLASNFPLCLFNKSYDDLWQQYQTLEPPAPRKKFSQQQRELLVYQNAKRIYRF